MMSTRAASGGVAPDVWDRFVAQHPDAHILQTSPWATLKAQFGWQGQRVGLAEGDELVAGAQVLYRRLPARLGCLAYVPRGPLIDWTDQSQVQGLLAALDAAARQRSCIALMVEPDLPDAPHHRERLKAAGFRPAPLTIQPARTIVVDIGPEEDQILRAMKSKTRYNTRLAARKGVTVREATEGDLPTFNTLMTTTGERDAFGVHAPDYYEAAFRLFAPRGWARLLIAEVAQEPVAALMVFALASRAWYFYGASANAHREKMPTYLLQWEAIRWAKSRGCTTYDLWGVPDADEEQLEAEFTRRQDGLWGVYRFKRGFGGRLLRAVGAWDRVYAPLRYWLYRRLLAARGRMQAALG